MEPEGKIIGVDPGDTTGIAIFESNGIFDTFGQMSTEEVEQFVTDYAEPVFLVVVEDFTLQRGRAVQQSGSKMKASQVIGMMRIFAAHKGARLIMQDPSKKDDGARLSQKFPPKNHAASHAVDAYNHAFFRMHQMGLVKSALERQRLGWDDSNG